VLSVLARVHRPAPTDTDRNDGALGRLVPGQWAVKCGGRPPPHHRRLTALDVANAADGR
jgi:hypothetical protein